MRPEWLVMASEGADTLLLMRVFTSIFRTNVIVPSVIRRFLECCNSSSLLKIMRSLLRSMKVVALSRDISIHPSGLEYGR